MLIIAKAGYFFKWEIYQPKGTQPTGGVILLPWAETSRYVSMVSQGVVMRRQKIAPDFKLMAVLEDLKGDSSLGDICRK